MRGRRGDVLVNWGVRNLPRIDEGCTVLNQPDAVALAVNKLRFYETLLDKGFGDIIPEYCTGRMAATAMLDSGESLLARTILTGSQGRGIIVVRPGDDLPDAPLYTEYVKKTAEYRVHVGAGGAFDAIMKRKRRSVSNDDVNYQVRNERNGWVFCRDDIGSIPESVLLAARNAVAALGLHFGAVDVGYHGPSSRTVVYEVNTAPGLEGTTLVRYADYIRNQA